MPEFAAMDGIMVVRRSLFRICMAIALLGVCSAAPAQRVNLARFQDVSADSVGWDNEAWEATDGLAHPDSRWTSEGTSAAHWLRVDFPFAVTVGSAQAFTGSDAASAVTNFRIEYLSGTSWVTAPGAVVTGNTAIDRNIIFSSPVTSTQFRFISDDDEVVRLRELALYPPNGGAGYPLGTDVEINLAWMRDTLRSSKTNPYHSVRAVDGFIDDTARWVSADNTGDDWMEVKLSGSHTMGSAHVYTGWGDQDADEEFKLQYYNGSSWIDIAGTHVVGNPDTRTALVLPFTVPVTADQVRYWAPGSGKKRLKELVLFMDNGGAGYPLGTGIKQGARPTQRFTDYDDVYHRIRNVAAGSTAIAIRGGGYIVADGATTDEEKQFQVLLNIGTESYRFRNRITGACLTVLDDTPGSVVVEGAYEGLPHQNWLIVDAGGDRQIVNAFSGLSLQTDTASPGQGSTIVQGAWTGAGHQKWSIVKHAPFPKKGIAGWTGYAGTFNVNWGYNWDGGDGTLGNGAWKFPTQQNAFWPGWGRINKKYRYYNGRARPDHHFTFNEPERSDQANMAVNKAIELWPRLERLHVPLVSPAPATYGGWISDFMDQAINDYGYRVDYMGVHWYGSPNGGDPSGFIGWLNGIHNAYNRPVIVNEFSTVDWGGNASWTEEDNYNFFAVFFWRAENLDWLNKYSPFLFNGGVPEYPWSTTAPRGNWINNGKPTAIGELFAAWDGEQYAKDDQQYIVHNKKQRKRLKNTGGSSAPDWGTIRESDASMQWNFLSAGGGLKLISSMKDGRLLSTDGTVVSFAEPGTTGSAVEWTRTHNSYGWYFINHPGTGKRLRLNDELNWDLLSDSESWDGLKFRFIKPFKPAGQPPPIGEQGESAVWLFDEMAGSQAFDETGHGYTGDLLNGPAWSRDPDGRTYLRFDGINDYVNVGATNPPDFTASVTVSCWARSDTRVWNDHGALVSKRSQFVLHPWWNEQRISFNVFDGGGAEHYAAFDLSRIPGFEITEWHHYTGVFNSETQQARLYVDGVFVTSLDIGSSQLRSDTGPLTIGRDDGMARYFDGDLDEVWVFARALSSPEVADLAAASDSDGDGLADTWELLHFGDLAEGGEGDVEGDGLTNLEEYHLDADPTAYDSDGDLLSDVWEAANGFDPSTVNTVFRWTAGGDGVSLYQEANWAQAIGAGDSLIINPNVPVNHDLVATGGNLGGGGFGASLDLGSRVFAFFGSVLNGSSNAGIGGGARGQLRLYGGEARIDFLHTITTHLVRKPVLRLRDANPFLAGATVEIEPRSSPRLIIEGATVEDVTDDLLASIRVEGAEAVPLINVVLVQAGQDVEVYRSGDTDGDGLGDRFEWENGYDPTDPADGSDDSDGDGLPFWMELRLGTSTGALDPGFRIDLLSMTNGQPVLELGPGGTNLRYRILGSANLTSNWEVVGEVLSGATPEPVYQWIPTNAPSGRGYYGVDVGNALQ